MANVAKTEVLVLVGTTATARNNESVKAASLENRRTDEVQKGKVVTLTTAAQGDAIRLAYLQERRKREMQQAQLRGALEVSKKNSTKLLNGKVDNLVMYSGQWMTVAQKNDIVNAVNKAYQDAEATALEKKNKTQGKLDAKRVIDERNDGIVAAGGTLTDAQKEEQEAANAEYEAALADEGTVDKVKDAAVEAALKEQYGEARPLICFPSGCVKWGGDDVELQGVGVKSAVWCGVEVPGAGADVHLEIWSEGEKGETSYSVKGALRAAGYKPQKSQVADVLIARYKGDGWYAGYQQLVLGAIAGGVGDGGGAAVEENGTWAIVDGVLQESTCYMQVGADVLICEDIGAVGAGYYCACVTASGGSGSESTSGVSYHMSSSVHASLPKSDASHFYVPIYLLEEDGGGSESEGGKVVVKRDFRKMPIFSILDMLVPVSS